jgi:hypothetical protein
LIFIKPLQCFWLIIAATVSVFPQSVKCPRGKQTLWFYPHEKLDARAGAGFSSQLFKELSPSLADIGYCLTPFDKTDTLVRSPLAQENLLMHVFLTETRNNRAPAAEIREPELMVVITALKTVNKGTIELTSLRPLLSLTFSPGDIENIRVIFEKKIVENLRTQYICNLAIASEPVGVRVTSSNGLSDVTPLEWVVPMGKLQIQCTRESFMPYKKNISLDRPGTYNYFLQLEKKQLFNSKFFIPALGMGVAAGICYGFEAYFYYGKYEKLDKNNDPREYEMFFNNAKTCETLTFTCLSVCASLLCLSIWF